MLPPGPTVREIRSFMRWYRITILLSVGVVLVCIGSDIPRVMTWYHVSAERKQLQNQVASFEHVLEEKHALKNQEQELTKQLAKIAAITNHSNWLFNYVLVAQNALGADAVLNSVSMNTKKFQLSFESADLPASMAAVGRLRGQAESFSSLVVASISQKSQEKTACSVVVNGLIV